jgi:hypothetical protein
VTATCQEIEPGVFVVTPGGIGPVRLVGLLFGAPGAWLLYQFLGGVLHPAEMTIFGWILLPIMAAVFLVPAWLILFGKKRTRIDTRVREAVEEFDLLVYTRRTTTAIPRDALVVVRFEVGSTSSRQGVVADDTVTRFMTTVNLAAGGKVLLLAIFAEKQKAEAMLFAGKIAGLLGADVQDRCFAGGEIAAGGVVVDRLGPDDAD